MLNRYLRNVVTLKLDEEKCRGCGTCLQVCPHQVFELKKEEEKEKDTVKITDRDRCMECGACVNNCPFSALEVRAGVGCAYGILVKKFVNSDSDCECTQNESGCC